MIGRSVMKYGNWQPKADVSFTKGKSEISDELISECTNWLGEEGIKFFQETKDKYGQIDAVYNEGGFPHPVHFREGMQVRNFMRDSAHTKDWPKDADYDSLWIDLIEKVLKAWYKPAEEIKSPIKRATTVINLLGGPGCGKSTTSCGLYYYMKLMGLSVELVREYVKSWAWQGRKIGPLDQLSISGKQWGYEHLLYGKVDYIVTDSPIILGGIFDEFYNNEPITGLVARRYLEKARESGVNHINIVMERHKPFVSQGRYETEEKAKEIDQYILTKLTEWNIPYQYLTNPDDQRVDRILEILNLKEQK
jgi:hypothetical protein